MKHLSIAELERTCQKPDHRRLGNWMARHVARPLALRVTWVVAPWGVSANAATLLAWAFGIAAAIAFAWGTTGGLVFGAALLQLWYLFDHVDGQLARLRGTSSLDGMQLDYLMHHTVDLAVPLGMGHGAFIATTNPVWLWLGVAWGFAALMLSLHHDARYKAFITRLKRVQGRLLVQGGGGDRPQFQPPIPRHPLRLTVYLARKACEAHVVMNTILVVALTSWLAADSRLFVGCVYLAAMAVLTISVALITIIRSQRNQAVEQEFAAWYRPADGDELIFRDGWWFVESTEDSKNSPHR